MKTLQSSKQGIMTRCSIFDDCGKVWNRCFEGQGILVRIIAELRSFRYRRVVLVSIFGFRMISEKEDSAFKSSWLVYSVVAVISVVTEWGVGFFETTLLAFFFSNSLHRKGATHSPLSHKTIIVAIETE